jgi:hypothetical protein
VKIFFGCRFGDFVLIPVRRVLGSRQEGKKHRSAALLPPLGFSGKQIIMPVTLPCHGRGGGGPGHHGGRDGGHGHGDWGGPLPCRERNPILASNSRNSTFATSISPLPCTPAPSAAVPPPPPAVTGP